MNNTFINNNKCQTHAVLGLRCVGDVELQSHPGQQAGVVALGNGVGALLGGALRGGDRHRCRCGAGGLRRCRGNSLVSHTDALWRIGRDGLEYHEASVMFSVQNDSRLTGRSTHTVAAYPPAKPEFNCTGKHVFSTVHMTINISYLKSFNQMANIL